MGSTLKLIATNGFICVNKTLIKKLGLNAAVLIGELASAYNYYATTNLLYNDFFYMTSKDCTEDTGLSYYELCKAIETLIQLGVLETKTMGLPAKKYFKLNENTLNTILETSNTSIENSQVQELKNLNTCVENIETNNNININNLNNNISLDNKLSKETQNDVDTFLSNPKSTIGYKASENKIRDPDNSKSYKKVVEFIESLKYNESTIQNLLLWYKAVGIGKVSIKTIKDRLTRLHLEHYTEQQISNMIHTAYINNYLTFCLDNSYKTAGIKTKPNDSMHLVSETVTDDMYIKNADGTIMEF